MYSYLHSALWILSALAVLNIVLISVLYAIKLRNVYILKAKETFQVKFKDYLVYIRANLESGERLRVPPQDISPLEHKFLQEIIIDMIESFAGDQREKLIDLCAQMGWTRQHMRRLRGRSYRRQIDAAYHLGCMRVNEAVPRMLKLLRKHKLDSSLFVLARAIAKCARDDQDLKNMVKIMIAKGKHFPDLLADIIEEAPVDQNELFTEFILSNHPSLIRIGLAGMKDYANPKIAAAVYRFMESASGDIQRKATEIYLRSAVFLPVNVANQLMDHPEPEVRLMAVQALSELKSTVYTKILQRSLQDADQRVVYAGALGLIHSGQEGMELFCKVAKERRDKTGKTDFQDIIEAELLSLAERAHALDHLARYNALKYTYEKVFGKTKKIYRIV